MVEIPETVEIAEVTPRGYLLAGSCLQISNIEAIFMYVYARWRLLREIDKKILKFVHAVVHNPWFPCSF